MELIGLLVFFVVSAITVPGLIYMQHQSRSELRASVAAGELNAISKAANDYIQSNYTTLSTKTGNSVISIQDLKDSGFLSNDVQDSNPYDAVWQVQIQQPQPGFLQGIITASGGTMMNQRELGLVSAQSHGVGGEVPPPHTNLANIDDGGAVAYGPYGAWKIDLTGYNNPGPGHLVGLLSYYNGEQINNDYLYRDSIPNHPELNTMQTNVDMGGNNINNYSVIQSAHNTDLVDSCDLDSSGHCIGQIMAAGTSENDLPQGWLGGMVSRDFYSKNGTISVGLGDNASSGLDQELSWMSDRGYYSQGPNTYGSGGVVGSGGDVGVRSPSNQFSANVTSTDSWPYSSVTTSGPDSGTSMRTVTNNSSINATYYLNGQGINNAAMDVDDTKSVVQAYNNTGGFASMTVPDGNSASANVSTSGYLLPGAIGTPGQWCPVNGALAANSNGTGEGVTCISGVWQNSSSSYGHVYSQYYGPGAYHFTNSHNSPMFVSTNCPNSSQNYEEVQIDYAGIAIREAGGNSHKGYHFSYIPAAFGIIPAYTDFVVNLIGGFPCTINFQY